MMGWGSLHSGYHERLWGGGGGGSIHSIDRER